MTGVDFEVQVLSRILYLIRLSLKLFSRCDPLLLFSPSLSLSRARIYITIADLDISNEDEALFLNDNDPVSTREEEQTAVEVEDISLESL